MEEDAVHEATLSLQVLFVLLAFVVRTVQQWRRTGASGFVPLRERRPAARLPAWFCWSAPSAWS